MKRKKILIIDDEENFCVLVKKNLELTGKFEVAIATDGKHGISLAKRLRPHLILQDIMMPGANGFEIMERLKSDTKTCEIPVAMLTAKEDDESKMKAAQLFDDEYITKPIEAAALRIKIDEILQRRNIGLTV